MAKINGKSVQAEQREYTNRMAAEKKRLAEENSIRYATRQRLIISRCEFLVSNDFKDESGKTYEPKDVKQLLHSAKVQLGYTTRSKVYKQAMGIN